jgi:hypothetical protein
MLGSTIGKNAALDACYGGGHSAAWPAVVYLRLYSGNPMSGGVELPSTGGYEALTVTNNTPNFPAASSGQKTNGIAFAMATSTGAWGAIATYWWFTDSDGNLLDGGPVSSPIIVVSTGTIVEFAPGTLVIAT